MPSLRKRVSTYLRQLSFHNEPRDKRHNVNENAFVTKYLQGQIQIREGPSIVYGKIPTDLPNYEIKSYDTGPSSIVGCYSGPNGGLTTVKRTEKHLSVLDADIDFIDTQDEVVPPPELPKKSPIRPSGVPIDNTTMVIKVAGHEYLVTNRPKGTHSKSHSLGSISDFNIEIEKTKIDTSNNNCDDVLCKNSIKSDNNVDYSETKEKQCDKNDQKNSTEHNNVNLNNAKSKVYSGTHPGGSYNRKMSNEQQRKPVVKNVNVEKQSSNYGLGKSKSEGNPFHHKKGKIIKIVQRPNASVDSTDNSSLPTIHTDDSSLPTEWNKKSETFYGISDSLYDRNQVTKCKNGDPIADCFGIIARNDSAILAVADGVNWGEKASIAAKSAVHGSLHYLNKTIFHDTKPFENLTIKTDESSTSSSVSSSDPTIPDNLISNTRDIFVCLLRAFNCAHDLILENNGMLTTLTVAVVLPLKQKGSSRKSENAEAGKDGEDCRYVCCVCNVGDTLAYVYSQKYGVREITKGSHDINCNRDMRDALGALGPVDGINPELSNLTLSITTLHKGDIVLVASDGLTDNFDPNVCKFSVNSSIPDVAAPKPKRPASATTKPAQKPQRNSIPKQTATEPIRKTDSSQKPPVKPPRRSKMRNDDPSSNRSSAERSSVKSSNSSTVAPPLETNFDQPPTDSNAAPSVEYDNPLVAQFMRENSVDASSKMDRKKSLVVENKASSLRKQAATTSSQSSRTKHNSINQKSVNTTPGYKFLRSKTTIDIRTTNVNVKPVLRNEDGIPYVTPIQRYEIQLLLMEDILKNGISGRDKPCTTARRLCENLISFTLSITSAKRHTLEDPDLYFDNRNGILVEVSGQEKKIRRKRGLEKVQNLPGKLDHVSIVAYNVGNCAF